MGRLRELLAFLALVTTSYMMYPSDVVMSQNWDDIAGRKHKSRTNTGILYGMWIMRKEVVGMNMRAILPREWDKCRNLGP